MTILFHRLTVPSYWNGLPSNYDYLNNATSGTPAYADGQKSTGPNVGTYFTAFGEDATSSDANRAAQALATNTDYLDNLLHADIALPVGTAATSSGGPLASLTLTGPGIFMGLAGATLAELFQVTDASDADIDVNGTIIVVTAAVDSGGSPVSVGGGFSTGSTVTLTFNISIPTGQPYRIWYSERTNFATFPADGLTTTHLRSLTEIDAGVEELFRTLHGNNLSWNASWTSTIYDLTTRGFGGMYTLSTTGSGDTPNTAGDTVATRTGPSVEMRSALSARTMPDPFNALWTADATADAAVTTNSDYGAVGSVGYLALSTRWMLSSEAGAAPAVAAMMNVATHPTPVGAPSVGEGYWTRLDHTATATITTGGFTGFYLLTLDNVSNTYFWKSDTGGQKRTGIALGRDLLRLTLSTGAVVTVRMVQLATGAAKDVYITALDGGPLDAFGTLPVSVTQLDWLSPTMVVGNGSMAAKQQFLVDPLPSGPIYNDDGLYVVIPPPYTDINSVPSTPVTYGQYNGPPLGVSANYFGRDTTTTDGGRILGWGAFDQGDIANAGGLWRELAYVTSDGGIHSGYVQQTYVSYGSTNIATAGNQITVSGTGAQTATLDVDHYDVFFINLTNATGPTLNLAFESLQHPSGYPLAAGRKIRVVILQQGTGAVFGGTNLLGAGGVLYPAPYGGTCPPLQGISTAIDVYEIEALPEATILGKVTRY